MNIALVGYGKMGKEIERLAPGRNITIKRIFEVGDNLEGEGLTKQSLKDVDVCIDFSTPEAVPSNIRAAAECGKNIVVGTTGWYAQAKELEAVVRSRKIGLVYSPNFSLGMNVRLKGTMLPSEKCTTGGKPTVRAGPRCPSARSFSRIFTGRKKCCWKPRTGKSPKIIST
jgi:dihydrodipicolinate reductase